MGIRDWGNNVLTEIENQGIQICLWDNRERKGEHPRESQDTMSNPKQVENWGDKGSSTLKVLRVGREDERGS